MQLLLYEALQDQSTQCQQRYIWHCSIYGSAMYQVWPAAQQSAVVVYIDPDSGR